MAESGTHNTVVILCICLIVLICLLVFFYKKLNREANDEYTIRNLVYKEGGVRDLVRGAALGLGTRFGIQLWPQSEEDGEEMQSVGDLEGQMDGDSSQRDDMDGEDEEEEEEDSMDQSGEAKEKGDDASSLEGSEAREEERLMDELEEKNTTEEKGEENLEKVGEGEGKGEATGLLIDLKQFSGSAIWSEEEGGEGKCGDVTAL